MSDPRHINLNLTLILTLTLTLLTLRPYCLNFPERTLPCIQSKEYQNHLRSYSVCGIKACSMWLPCLWNGTAEHNVTGQLMVYTKRDKIHRTSLSGRPYSIPIKESHPSRLRPCRARVQEWRNWKSATLTPEQRRNSTVLHFQISPEFEVLRCYIASTNFHTDPTTPTNKIMANCSSTVIKYRKISQK